MKMISSLFGAVQIGSPESEWQFGTGACDRHSVVGEIYVASSLFCIV